MPEDVNHYIMLRAGWKCPQCPFCSAEIVRCPFPPDVAECRCGALYSYNSGHNMAEAIDRVAKYKFGEAAEASLFIYHNYSREHHAYNIFLESTYDAAVPESGLGHLWFVISKEKTL